MSRFVIRRADLPAEAALLTELIRRSFATVAEEFGFTPENAPVFPAFLAETKLHEIAGRGAVFYVACEGETVAGCVAIERASGSLFYLEKLAVPQAYRHFGLGRMLMDHAFSEAAQQGAERISIAVVYDNRVLVKWYEDYGFAVTEVKKFDHLPFTVCYMEKGVPVNG